MLVPVVAGGYHPSAATSNLTAAQFAALDDLLACYPILTLVHIARGLLFMMLGPAAVQLRHTRTLSRWHRLSGRIFVICGVVIGSQLW